MNIFSLKVIEKNFLQIFSPFHQTRRQVSAYGGSRHLASIGNANLICFPVSHVYFFVGEGPMSIAKLDGGHDRICPLDSPLATIILLLLMPVLMTCDTASTTI